MKKSDNHYFIKCGIVLMLLSAFFGSLVPALNIDCGFFILTPFRVVLLLLSILCFVAWIYLFLHKRMRGIVKQFKLRSVSFFVFFAWFLFSVIWYIKGDCLDLAKTEIIGILVLLMLSFCFSSMIWNLDSLLFGLRAYYGCTLLVSLLADVEVIIGSFNVASANYHTVEERIALGQTLFPPTAVFTNPNDLAAILLIGISIGLFFLFHAQSAKSRILYYCTLVLLLLPTPFIGSTIFFGGVILLGGVSVLYSLAVYRASRGLKWVSHIALTVVLYSTVFVTRIKKLGLALNEKYFVGRIMKAVTAAEEAITSEEIIDEINSIEVIAEQNNVAAVSDSLVSQADALSRGGGTIHIRLWLLKAGTRMIKNHPFLGVGPAGFRKQMLENHDLLMETREIVDPHNFPVEVLAQYGVFVFGLLFAQLVALLIRAVKYIKKECREKKPGQGILYLLILVSFCIASVMPSSFIRFFPAWIPMMLLITGYDLESIGALGSPGKGSDCSTH